MSAVGRERKQGHQANKQVPEGCRLVFQPLAHCNCAQQPGVSGASEGLANNGATDRAALGACREGQPGTLQASAAHMTIALLLVSCLSTLSFFRYLQKGRGQRGAEEPS